MLTRKTVILAKIESSYGVDSTPTGSLNAIEVRNPNIQPLAGDVVERDVVRPYLGNFESIPANTHVIATFEVYVAGAGGAGTVPKYGPLLRACGMAETVTASTKVEYSPVSAAFESVVIYFNKDGVLHKMTGCRGTVTLTIDAQGLPVYAFTFTGLYNAPTDTALPTADYSGFLQGVIANNTNTTGFTVHGFSGVLQSLNFALNNAVQPRLLVGSESVIITDRRPSGELLFEAPTIAAKNFFSLAKNGTKDALAIQHGQAAGNIVKLDMPKVSFGQPTYEDSQGVGMLRLPCVANPNAGNDEFKITVQ